jgi:hypothetical protein
MPNLKETILICDGDDFEITSDVIYVNTWFQLVPGFEQTITSICDRSYSVYKGVGRLL